MGSSVGEGRVVAVSRRSRGANTGGFVYAPVRIHDMIAATETVSVRSRAMNLLILVVDDEPDVEALFRQQFRRELRTGRFVMEFAGSAAQALERVMAAAEGSLILLLSDINMPGMTGLELLPRVKALRPGLPVIMITAYGDAGTIGAATAAGADGVFGKPIDFAALKMEIDDRLQARGVPA